MVNVHKSPRMSDCNPASDKTPFPPLHKQEIPQMMEGLRERIALARDRLTHLRQRLRPVLRQIPEAESNADPKLVQTELGAEIDQATSQVGQICKELGAILEDLEV